MSTIVYHPDSEIDAEIAADALEAERVDLAAGYPPRRWTCPCGASHSRGHVQAIGVHRCLRCGYVGTAGVMSTEDEPVPHGGSGGHLMSRIRTSTCESYENPGRWAWFVYDDEELVGEGVAASEHAAGRRAREHAACYRGDEGPTSTSARQADAPAQEST